MTFNLLYEVVWIKYSGPMTCQLQHSDFAIRLFQLKVLHWFMKERHIPLFYSPSLPTSPTLFPTNIHLKTDEHLTQHHPYPPHIHVSTDIKITFVSPLQHTMDILLNGRRFSLSKFKFPLSPSHWQKHSQTLINTTLKATSSFFIFSFTLRWEVSELNVIKTVGISFKSN